MITLAKFNKTKKEDVIAETKNEIVYFDGESAKISQILSDDLYKKVAQIIGLDENIKEKLKRHPKTNYKRMYRKLKNVTALIQKQANKMPESDYSEYSSSVEPPTMKEKSQDKDSMFNAYYEFFHKTEREQVRWESKYLPPETEMEKGLIRRADDLTNKICSDFCTYMNGLGGYDSPLFKEETVKKIFQIEFNTHIAKSLQVNPKQLKSVPKSIANLGNYQKDYVRNALRHEVDLDIKAENKPANLIGFGKKLNKDFWIPPKNRTEETWRTVKNTKNISTTMENVCDGITTLKSMHDFCQRLIDHPQTSQPAYLRETGMLDRVNLSKLKHIHKFSAINKLSIIDLKKQLTETEKTKTLIPTANIKILK